MKNIIIASTSTVHGKKYLEYLLPELKSLFKGIEEIVFIPYARPGGVNYDDYTERARSAFAQIGIAVKGIHEFVSPKAGLEQAKGVYVGGGNTFELVTQLYANNIMEALKKRVEAGMPYIGTSAGSNITGVTMKTTNDMPIVYPPSFDTLNLTNFNINAHYLDPDPSSTHMGETRETRIKEFHAYNNTPVLGVREGSWLAVNGDKITLKGPLQARLFLKGETPTELEPNSDVSHLGN